MSWTVLVLLPSVAGVINGPGFVALLSGLALGLGLIVAIGALNRYVLRQGLLLRHVFAVVAVCTFSDVVLIGAGVLGAGAVVARVPALLRVVCVGGAVFLLAYAFAAARRAWRPAALAVEAGGRQGLLAAVGTCLALTWLNPHVYLDTVVLLGSTASTFGPRRWDFAVGAALGSALWFAALGFGARLLRPMFSKPVAWRVLDGVIAAVMVILAVSLALRGISGG